MVATHDAGLLTGRDSTAMQACAARHCQSVRWRTGRRAFESSQCTLTHRTSRHLRLRCSGAECDLLGRAKFADGQSHPVGSFPLPEDFP
jgi:hypothetical protein